MYLNCNANCDKKGKVIKMKKILSVLLTVVMLFGVFAIVACAESTTIDVVELDFDIDIAGVNVYDYEDYIDILTEGLEFEDNYEDPGVFVYDADYESFYDDYVEGETYYMDIYLTPEEGYELGDIDTAYVNGYMHRAFVSSYYPYDDELEVYYVCISIEFIVGEELVDNCRIDYVDVAIDTDIAGFNASDYEEFVYIFTDGLEFEDNYGDPGVYVFDSNGEQFEGEFVAGETYCFYVYLSPLEGYSFADEIYGCVNGEDVETYISYWEPGEEYGDITVDFVALEYELTVTESVEVEELSILEQILRIIMYFFSLIFGI